METPTTVPVAPAEMARPLRWAIPPAPLDTTTLPTPPAGTRLARPPRRCRVSARGTLSPQAAVSADAIPELEAGHRDCRLYVHRQLAGWGDLAKAHEDLALLGQRLQGARGHEERQS
eukprot:scaffold1182_cov396-Prasinococcus_capsulatus_cf.AAC.20